MTAQPPAPTPLPRDPAEHAWDMALYSFRMATKDITEMARSPDYRDMAVEDLGEIAEVALAANRLLAELKSKVRQVA